MPYLTRVQKLQKTIQELGCDALLIDDPLNTLYLTGLNLSAGKLLIHANGAYLIVDNRYFELCQKTSPFPVLPEGNFSFEVHLARPDLTFIKTLGFDSENTSYKNYLEMEKCVKKAIEQNRKLTLIPLDNPVKKQRMIKDPSEIAILREAASLGSKGYDFVCSFLKEGISESEVALELEIFWKKQGSKALAFEPIIAFGANSSMPHYRAGNERLKKGHVVLIDIGVNYRHYHSDMTRVLYFGEPDEKIRRIFSIVEEAQKAALKICRPGTLIGEVDAAARDHIASKGLGENFTHSLGHGIGLEIHEFPILRNSPPYKEMPLEAGMVITIEPGIYLPGIGGVRLEDSIVITEKGYEDLTRREIDPFRLNRP